MVNGLLAAARVLAILRTPHTVPVAGVLAEHGFGLCEVPLTVPHALEAIAAIEGTVGAGTVLTAAQARDAVAASGAAAVKLFPAATGGPAHLAARRTSFPDIALVAVGGIAISEVPAYLDAGALAVGLGAPLIGDGNGVAQRAQTLRKLLS